MDDSAEIVEWDMDTFLTFMETCDTETFITICNMIDEQAKKA